MKKRPPLMVSLSNPERGPLILSLSKDFFIRLFLGGWIVERSLPAAVGDSHQQSASLR
jgi:hypothetical protein